MSVESIQLELNQFTDQIKAAHQRLKGYTRDIEQKENDIQRVLSHLLDVYPVLENQTSLQQVTTLLNEEILVGIQKKIQYLKNMAERKSFVDQFDESLVLMVFGTVNSGKSTLGNFLSGEPIRTKGYQFGQTPVFYRYTDMLEQSKEAIKIESFREGRTETTSEIQHFTLEKGLTWVDTPGILSMTKENENLAKHYVELADLVLIVTSSSSPTKASELVDFTKIINKGKEVVVLITKSDTIEIDEIDGKLVNNLQPKSVEDRVLQETYTKEQLTLANPESWQGAEIQSISIKLANEAFETGDLSKYEDSQIRGVFELIGEKLTADALRLKVKRPRQALNQWINEIEVGNEFIVGLDPLIHRLSDKKQVLQTKYDAFHDESSKIKKEILRAANLKMDEWMLGLYAEDATDENVLGHIHEVESVLVDLMSDYVEEALYRLLEEHGQMMQFDEGVKINLPVEQIYKEIETTDYSVGSRSRNPKGLVEHVGAVLFKKEYTESYIREKKTIKRVVVGNNAKEQLEKARNQMLKHLITQLEQQLGQIQQNILGGSITLLDQLIQRINQAKKELNDLRYKEISQHENIHA